MQLFQKKYPLDSFLFLYPWSLKSFGGVRLLPFSEHVALG